MTALDVREQQRAAATLPAATTGVTPPRPPDPTDPRRPAPTPAARSWRQAPWGLLGRLPRLRLLTPLSVGCLLAAVVAFTVARLFGWQELTVLAVVLVSVVLVALPFAAGRARYEVDVDISNQRVVAGEEAFGRVLVRNAAQRRLLPVRMELPVGSRVGTVAVPALRAGEEHEALLEIPTARRSVVVVGPAVSVRGDAFGLVRRVLRWNDAKDVYVHPRTVRLQSVPPGLIKDLEGQTVRALSNSDVAFHALRDYVPGDESRYIHWKTQARTGKLMVRQFEETRRSHLAIALSCRTAEYRDGDEFELAVSVAASLAGQCYLDRRAVDLVTGTGAIAARSRNRFLDRTSALELGSETPGLVSTGRRAVAAVPSMSAAVLLCGSVPIPADLRRAGTPFRSALRVIGVRCVGGAALGVSRIGRMPVITLGTLDDLPRAMRAVRG